MKKVFGLLFLCTLIFSACYHRHPVKTLKKADQVKTRTLFIGLDGVDYTLMRELKDEGQFSAFQDPIPLVSTFPTATTIGFTGIFQPLNVGQVSGYEVRFYSYADNKIIGGTPKDLYKIPINYKYYFDSFRHTMQEKGVMYAFPSMASVQDLNRTHDVVLDNPKRVVMTYLGGTDGSAHILGRGRTKRTLKYMSGFLDELTRKYTEKKGEPLRIVMFSDHGFQYTDLKIVSNAEIKHKLAAQHFHEASNIKGDRDIVLTRFGLLSSGVGFAHEAHRNEVSHVLCTVKGVDLTFWHEGNPSKIYMCNHNGDEAYFEFNTATHGESLTYKYVATKGDPLGYNALLKSKGRHAGVWLSEKVWLNLSYDHEYPDAGYRLYDAFFTLVKNQAGLMFSLKPNYQFGPLVTYLGTLPRIGQRGTHGGLFKQSTWAFVMTNQDSNKNPPRYLRYDQMFRYYLPDVVRAQLDEVRKQNQNSIHEKSVTLNADDMESLKKQLAALEETVMQ